MRSSSRRRFAVLERHGTSGYAAPVSLAPRYDVAIIGAGIAGLAASVLLRNAGLSVVCLDVQAYPHRKVGESLDWSSPGLLRRVGIDADALIADEIATYKKNIVVCELGKTEWTATPPPASGDRRCASKPSRCTSTGRPSMRGSSSRRARSGPTFIWERVTERGRGPANAITGCSTTAGRRVEARWYIDASGTARVLSRAMGIPIVAYGRQKVCLWTYFDTPPLHDGTAFFVDNVTTISVGSGTSRFRPRQTSVGFVLPAETVRARRRAGSSVETILREELARHPRFRGLLDAQPALEVESTSFQPYVTAKVCGANWLMIGEAASMPDPLTGNGVTSGIRHASHAVDAILSADAADAIDPRAAPRLQPSRLPLGHAFNAHIENAIYRHPIAVGSRLQGGDLRLHDLRLLHERPARALRAARDRRHGGLRLLFVGARAWIGGWTLVARARSGGRLHGER